MNRARHWLGLLLCLTPLSALAQDDTLKSRIRADFRHHYSAEPWLSVAAGFAVTALFANSDADEEIQRVFRNKLQGQAGDSMSELFTDVGDLAQPVFSIPIYLTAMWLGDGNGAAEGEPGWNPFDDYNGVSGHAFYGAVPLITAARMSQRRWLRLTLYAVSAWPGLARIYDDKHYASQAFMGWWLAYAATRTVEHTNAGRESRAHIVPLLYPDGGGLQFNIRF